MVKAILGKKLGVTDIFTDDGRAVCVTVIEAGPCPVLEVKQKALKVGFGEGRERTMKKPILGLFKKLNIPPCKKIGEVPRDASAEYKVGDSLKVDIFKAGDFVDVTGRSKGKGFQGGMKRWNWSGGPMTHGSTSHRRVGSIGSTTSPGRVWKGHHMPGHMGDCRVTVQNLRVIKVDPENNLILVEGAVPGAKNGNVTVRSAKKKKAAS
jgi:large subunit ribosomal protein L3